MGLWICLRVAATCTVTLGIVAGCAGGTSLLPRNVEFMDCANAVARAPLLDSDGGPTRLLRMAAESAAFDQSLFKSSEQSSGEGDGKDVLSSTKGSQVFEGFLACYAGPADLNSLEQRLLRGHLIVTMMALYGEYNIRKLRYDTGHKAADARALLEQIRVAEVALRLRSDAALEVPDDRSVLNLAAFPSVRRVDGMVDVFNVAVAAHRPAINSARALFGGVLGVAQGDFAKLSQVVNISLDAVAQSARLELYGPAGVWDMRWMMSCFSGKEQKPTIVDLDSCSKFGLQPKPESRSDMAAYWRRVDSELDRVCTRLNVHAGNSLHLDCTPSRAILIEQFPDLQGLFDEDLDG